MLHTHPEVRYFCFYARHHQVLISNKLELTVVHAIAGNFLLNSQKGVGILHLMT